MFFDRPESGELAILVQIGMESAQDEADAREFEQLAIAAGAIPAATIISSRKSSSPRFLVGTGKIEEISAALKEHSAQLVMFNHTLSPSQERNLEKELSCRVVDRTGVILDIFAQRARSHEGKLQVELAKLKHASTRLVRGWTHLDRQKGGIGQRGVGETQLELDQRLIGERIKQINRNLEKVRAQRAQSRRARVRAEVPTVALVGYTNAGKSSLFNRLSGDSTFVANMLFATLDSTLRKVQIPNYGTAILADTVGFVRDLPHQLVDAFRATLEETVEARLLLHVVDCNDDERQLMIEEVDKVLHEIGADDIPTLMVFNKVDLLGSEYAGLERDEHGKPVRAWVSAHTGAGVTELTTAISELLGGDMLTTTLTLDPAQGRQRARLYRLGVVKDERNGDDGSVILHLQMPRADLMRLIHEEQLDPAAFDPSPYTDVPVPHENSGIAPVDEPHVFR